MEQRLSLVTLAVRDVAASRRFYIDGLGWRVHLEVTGEVLMLQVAPALLLSLWDRARFEAEIGAPAAVDGVAPLTLAHNVATDGEVDAVLAEAGAAGASSVTAAQQREWGGYSGYFADPDGFRWEVAHVPGDDSPINAVVLPQG